MRSARVTSQRWSGARWSVWADLSLRTKLLLFAAFLVFLPGSVFALIAFSGARTALQREVGIQLSQSAEQGAHAVSATLERARSDARSWASQDLMRDLVVGDLDKRVSKFLVTTRAGQSAYLDVLCVDPEGRVVAASDGRWLGRSLDGWASLGALRNHDEVLAGPTTSILPGRQVLEIAVPIRNPDLAGAWIGVLVLVYDWSGIRQALDDIRLKLGEMRKQVVPLVVDRDGRVIGGDSGAPQGPFANGVLEKVSWQLSTETGYARRRIGLSDGASTELLMGFAPVSDARPGWSVLVIEPVSQAFAPIRAIRRRWAIALGGILLLGLAIAAVLAHQVVRPLAEVTRATAELASHQGEAPALLPVTSRNEVGQLAESFNKMTVQLKRSQEEALSAAKFAFAGELAAMIAHEVRTPLSVMRSSAQMLAGSPASGAKHDPELAETIVAEVDRIERVVTGLLEIVHPLPQQVEPTLLEDVLRRSVAFVGAQAERQKVRVETDFDGSRSRALCDPELMYQAVLNLVVNALQALSPGGSIRLRTHSPHAGWVEFEVEDDGPGLPENLRDRIFEPFVSGREQGTGLGLAFVDRVVRANGGSVSVQSQTGQGTVFRVRLPAAEVSA